MRRSFNLNGEDSIIYAGELSGVQALQNIDKAFVYGIESGLRIHPLKNVTLASYLTFTHGEEQAEETGDEYVPLRHAPPLYGSTHISYQMKNSELTCMLIIMRRCHLKNLHQARLINRIYMPWMIMVTPIARVGIP